MKSITLLILFSLLAITSLTTSISSCNKNDYSTPKDTIRADPEFLEWWWCKEGSWWVYKRIDDTAQVMYDTAKVVLQAVKTTFEPRFSVSAITTYNLHLEHSSLFFTKSVEDGRQLLSTASTNANGLYSYVRVPIEPEIRGHDYFTFKWILNWPLEYKFNVPDANRVTLIDSNRLTKPILNKPTLHYNSPARDGEVWISKNIGIVKYKFGYDSSVWELVDYHINP